MQIFHRVSSWCAFAAGCFLVFGCKASHPPQRPSSEKGREKAVPVVVQHEINILQEYLAAHPNDPAALYNLAIEETSIDHRTAALDLLEKMSQAHAGLDPAGGAWRSFKDIAADPRFTAVVARVRRENPPVIRSRVAYTLSERDFTPEGIAWDPVEKKLYLSSIAKRKIVCLDSDGTVTDFKSARQNGLGLTLGVKVDAKRRFLWVVTDVPQDGENAGIAAVFQYDLKTGALRFKHQLPQGTEAFLNDVALTSKGEAFVTDTLTGAVYRMSPDHDGIEPFLQSDAVGQANGIVVAPGDKVLLVAGWLGVVRVDLATGEYRLLTKAQWISDAGLDGICFYRGALVGIQNPDLHPGRVMRYTLNASLDEITSAEVLEAYSPELELPTTGVIVGDSFLFVGDTQMDREQLDHSMPPLSELKDIHILKLKL